MKRLIATLVLMSIFLYVIGCAPAPPASAPSSDAAPEVTEDLQELDDLGSLADEVNNDVSFDELEKVDLQ